MNPDKQRPDKCPECGSENVEWEYNGIDEYMYCVDCEWTGEEEGEK